VRSTEKGFFCTRQEKENACSRSLPRTMGRQRIAIRRLLRDQLYLQDFQKIGWSSVNIKRAVPGHSSFVYCIAGVIQSRGRAVPPGGLVDRDLFWYETIFNLIALEVGELDSCHLPPVLLLRFLKTVGGRVQFNLAGELCL